MVIGRGRGGLVLLLVVGLVLLVMGVVVRVLGALAVVGEAGFNGKGILILILGVMSQKLSSCWYWSWWWKKNLTEWWRGKVRGDW